MPGRCALVLTLLTSFAVAQVPAGKGYETVKVADGIYTFVAPEPYAPIVSGNSTVIIGDDGALVVDSGMYPSRAKAMIAEIRQWTDKPVRVLVNTHWHWDHLNGNRVYRETFPDITILSTETTRASIAKYDPPQYKQAETYPTLLDRVKKAVETGKRGNGTPLSDDDRRTYGEAIPEIEQHLPDMAALRYEPPNMAFEKEMTIWLGKREVRVLFLGRANTGGDALVYVPDAKTIITGDLLVYPTPYGIGSFIGDWAKTMDKLMAVDAVNIVPGHGPVMHDWSYARQVQALLVTTLEQTRAAAANGASLEDVRKKVDLSAQQKIFAGASERKNRYFHDYWIVPAVGRAYLEVKGTLTEEEQ